MSADINMPLIATETGDLPCPLDEIPSSKTNIAVAEPFGYHKQRNLAIHFQSAPRLAFFVFITWILVLTLAFDNPWELLGQNWPITPISFFAATFANATAIGGGFLFVPLFIFAYGLNPIAALKLSLATQAFGMSSGALGWSKEFIVFRAIMIASITSVLGMYIGTYVLIMSNTQVKSVFAWVSLFIFIVMLLEIRFGGASHNRDIRNDSRLKASLFSLACLLGGMITAWTAIGIGEVVALYLLFVYRVRMDSAIATGVSVLAIDSVVGLFFHAHIGGINWEYLVFTAPGVILGGYFGARLGRLIENNKTPAVATPTDNDEVQHSPLKWLFGAVIFLDSMVMLLQSYVF